MLNWSLCHGVCTKKMVLGAFSDGHSLDRNVTFFLFGGIHTRSHKILPNIQPRTYVCIVRSGGWCQRGTKINQSRFSTGPQPMKFVQSEIHPHSPKPG